MTKPKIEVNTNVLDSFKRVKNKNTTIDELRNKILMSFELKKIDILIRYTYLDGEGICCETIITNYFVNLVIMYISTGTTLNKALKKAFSIFETGLLFNERPLKCGGWTND